MLRRCCSRDGGGRSNASVALAQRQAEREPIWGRLAPQAPGRAQAGTVCHFRRWQCSRGPTRARSRVCSESGPREVTLPLRGRSETGVAFAAARAWLIQGDRNQVVFTEFGEGSRYRSTCTSSSGRSSSPATFSFARTGRSASAERARPSSFPPPFPIPPRCGPAREQQSCSTSQADAAPSEAALNASVEWAGPQCLVSAPRTVRLARDDPDDLRLLRSVLTAEPRFRPHP
jgi:hypothetical protein